GVDHQPLDCHFDLHDAPRCTASSEFAAAAVPVRPGVLSTTSPRKLFGFALVMRTGTIAPIQLESPAKFTTVLPLVRPESSHSRRRLRESTRTGSTRPIACWYSSPWMSRSSACSAAVP